MSIKVASTGCFRASAFPVWGWFVAPILLMVLACRAILASLWKVGARVSMTVEHRKERGSL